ncbi:tetratricopeptide repeat protein [Sphingomonas daechungensis]|uniref:tetratricopeptide repeat protein n=1 Tax=Sphingomonas daechungensis TaxID=1176646 RepID=UPI0031E8327A
MHRQLPFSFSEEGSGRHFYPRIFDLRQVLAVPTDSNDTFLREVDENLRRDRLQDFFQKNAKWIALAVILFLAAAGGWIYWEQYQNKKAAEESEQLHAIFNDIAQNKRQTVPQRVEKLEKSGNDIVRATALFTSAALSLEKNDRTAAVAKYREIVNDKGLPDAYRDAGNIRLTALEFDTIKPDEVIARMAPLAKAGNPWFGSAGEMTALALLKQGKRAEAGRMFAAVAADTQVPGSIRARAVQVAGTLGVDASASMPPVQQ